MTKRWLHRKLAIAGIALAASTLLIAATSLSGSVSAGSSRGQKGLVNEDARRHALHSDLKLRLASTKEADFQNALTDLMRLDEPGALEVWQAALNNPDPRLRRKAWTGYQGIQSELARKQFVPTIARIEASADDVRRIAEANGLDVGIWTSFGRRTFAAVPPYLIERLRNTGIEASVLYDSVADWQKARASGDVVAQSITPDYLSPQASGTSQMRVAVVDLSDRVAANTGYSDWLGDHENFLMRDGSRLAYLDIFTSDGSVSSIAAHIEEQYTRRGFKLLGFYTMEQFAEAAPRHFPGKSFNPGRRVKTTGEGDFSIALSNGKFHSYEQTITEFKSLASAHPDLARYVKLGSSFEGREIFALKISKDAEVDDSSKPDVMITGCHHAREWISVESPVYVANNLISGYTTDDSIKYLVDHLQVWIVPIVNPDGLNYTQSAPNEQLDPTRLWRKNRRPISIGSCASSVGVDLNRNYDYQWRTRGDNPCDDYCSPDHSCFNDDMGGSDDLRSEIYRGPGPGSEPEVKAVKSLVDDPNRHFRAQLDFHNYSQLVLYPWGYAPWGTDDAQTLSRLAQQISDAMFGIDRVRYRPQQAIDLYATSGSSIDYAYGANHVPAPFLVEMRPDCCDFIVPESQIAVVNQENWAGTKALMTWAAGPPILESVKAYAIGSDGMFSKLVYSVRWMPSPDDPTAQRQLIIDTHFSGIDPGALQLRLQFSKPMNTSLAPRATLGRDGRFDEVVLSAIGDGEGWQKTDYSGDTWIGETVIIEDQNLTSPWQLAVSASDALGFALDGVPGTVASYVTGSGRWQKYEDSTGVGNIGGVDTQHTLAPGVRGDYPSVLMASPNGGERLAGGDFYSIVWTAPNAAGADQSLLLSTDGGFSFKPLVENVPSNAQSYNVIVPQVSTTRGRIRLVAVDPATHSFIFAGSRADFTIGLNVGSAVDINFVSSERMDSSWSDTSFDDPTVTLNGASRFIVNLRIANRGIVPIANPFLRVAQLTRNVLLTRDPRSSWATGARLSVDAGSDNILSPGETADARLVVGLTKPKKFFLSVALYGVASGGTIAPADAVNVWSGKPKNR
ncbi:MAG TPA: M14 family metallopeptidase [Blastocatellia bacterium]|nr:M14 family metallopeptidase [Blastocatellia bacterium]